MIINNNRVVAVTQKEYGWPESRLATGCEREGGYTWVIQWYKYTCISVLNYWQRGVDVGGNGLWWSKRHWDNVIICYLSISVLNYWQIYKDRSSYSKSDNVTNMLVKTVISVLHLSKMLQRIFHLKSICQLLSAQHGLHVDEVGVHLVNQLLSWWFKKKKWLDAIDIVNNHFDAKAEVLNQALMTRGGDWLTSEVRIV